jgi:hypothetical protein
VIKESSTTNDSPSLAGPVVAGAELHHTRVLLKVFMGKEHLEAEKRVLDNNQLDTADKILASVQHGVMSSYVEVDLPPVHTRQNLMLAKAQIEAGQK